MSVARRLAALATIESGVDPLVVPLAHANETCSLDLHIDRLRNRLLAAGVDAQRSPSTRVAAAPPRKMRSRALIVAAPSG